MPTVIRTTVPDLREVRCDHASTAARRGGEAARSAQRGKRETWHSPVYGILVALVDVGHRGGCGCGRRGEDVLRRLRRGRWILGVSRTHTPEVWTVMKTGDAAGTVWIVQPCASTATTALEVTPVQPAIVVL